MYITYKDKDYPCKCKIGQTMVYSGLPEEFPEAISGEIALKADDGFMLRADIVENYLRYIYENGTLTLSNLPEPEPTPEPEYPETEEITIDDMATAILEGVNEI